MSRFFMVHCVWSSNADLTWAPSS